MKDATGPEVPDLRDFDFDLVLCDLHPEPDDFLGEVLAGLSSEPRTLPSKYFYDEVGSRLFDRICELEEYYPTRTEIGILERFGPEIAERLGDSPVLVEIGSGSSTKTHILMRALRDAVGYVPIDISREHLLAAAERIAFAFPSVPVWPVCADFCQKLSLPEELAGVGRPIAFFPGSTIGNFTPDGRHALLQRLVGLCGAEGGGLLIGVDLKKDVARLEAAYNDREGVTAAFNLNLLQRINRELGASFDVSRFRHRARYNEAEGCIETHLVSEVDQSVSLGGEQIRLRRGEGIHSEVSYKFTVEEFSEEAAQVGLVRDAYWVDDEGLFALIYLKPERS